MAEQVATAAAPIFPNPGFYLRFKPADLRKWVRRNAFALDLGWSPCWMFEMASAFETREEALAFARTYRLEKDVELVTLQGEAVHAA